MGSVLYSHIDYRLSGGEGLARALIKVTDGVDALWLYNKTSLGVHCRAILDHYRMPMHVTRAEERIRIHIISKLCALRSSSRGRAVWPY